MAENGNGPGCTGTVFKKSQGTYFVHSQVGDIACAISNQLRKTLEYPIAAPTSISPHVVAVKKIGEVDPVAIGDEVEFFTGSPGTGMIVQVMPRRNRWSRKSADKRGLEQVIVANVDQVVAVMAAAQPHLKWELLDRFLAAAESAELPVLICMTKMDLADREAITGEVMYYRALGYGVVMTSVVTGEGIDDLKQALRNHTSVLIGKSGVGKSTLLNKLQPGLGLRVNEVSESTGTGTHTTTHLEMFDLAWGGRVVDTPGMREFAFWEVQPNELAVLFPEMRPHLGLCQFRTNCSHSHEPGCAVKRAVGAGEISERRYESYLRMKK